MAFVHILSQKITIFQISVQLVPHHGGNTSLLFVLSTEFDQQQTNRNDYIVVVDLTFSKVSVAKNCLNQQPFLNI